MLWQGMCARMYSTLHVQYVRTHAYVCVCVCACAFMYRWMISESATALTCSFCFHTGHKQLTHRIHTNTLLTHTHLQIVEISKLCPTSNWIAHLSTSQLGSTSQALKTDCSDPNMELSMMCMRPNWTHPLYKCRIRFTVAVLNCPMPESKSMSHRVQPTATTSHSTHTNMEVLLLNALTEQCQLLHNAIWITALWKHLWFVFYRRILLVTLIIGHRIHFNNDTSTADAD
jgi:hypothetical protein